MTELKKSEEDEYQRYPSNPFTDGLSLSLATKNIRITRAGVDDNILINQKTGEVASTHVVAQRRVDSEKFVKTFADYMSFTFELTKAGNKALRVVMWGIQEQSINSDTIVLDEFTRTEFLKEHDIEFNALSYPTYARGLRELCKAKIIAKTLRKSFYYINPSVLFNGDRVVFSTILEKKSKDEEVRSILESNGQQRLD